MSEDAGKNVARQPLRLKQVAEGCRARLQATMQINAPCGETTVRCMLDSWSVGEVEVSKAVWKGQVPLSKLLGREIEGQAMLTYHVNTKDLQLEGPRAAMKEVLDRIYEHAIRIYEHAIENGRDKVPATPLAFENLICGLPEESQPEEKEFQKGLSEWVKCQTVSDEEDNKQAVSEKVLGVMWESSSAGASDVYEKGFLMVDSGAGEGGVLGTTTVAKEARAVEERLS